jgi:hypothetical protein
MGCGYVVLPLQSCGKLSNVDLLSLLLDQGFYGLHKTFCGPDSILCILLRHMDGRSIIAHTTQLEKPVQILTVSRFAAISSAYFSVIEIAPLF